MVDNNAKLIVRYLLIHFVTSFGLSTTSSETDATDYQNVTRNSDSLLVLSAPEFRCSLQQSDIQNCESGFCFDAIHTKTERIETGCATSPMVCTSVGCSLTIDHLFICCCSRPFCNGKSPKMVKARWRMYQNEGNFQQKLFLDHEESVAKRFLNARDIRTSNSGNSTFNQTVRSFNQTHPKVNKTGALAVKKEAAKQHSNRTIMPKQTGKAEQSKQTHKEAKKPSKSVAQTTKTANIINTKRPVPQKQRTTTKNGNLVERSSTKALQMNNTATKSTTTITTTETMTTTHIINIKNKTKEGTEYTEGGLLLDKVDRNDVQEIKNIVEVRVDEEQLPEYTTTKSSTKNVNNLTSYPETLLRTTTIAPITINSRSEESANKLITSLPPTTTMQDLNQSMAKTKLEISINTSIVPSPVEHAFTQKTLGTEFFERKHDDMHEDNLPSIQHFISKITKATVPSINPIKSLENYQTEPVSNPTTIPYKQTTESTPSTESSPTQTSISFTSNNTITRQMSETRNTMPAFEVKETSMLDTETNKQITFPVLTSANKYSSAVAGSETFQNSRRTTRSPASTHFSTTRAQTRAQTYGDPQVPTFPWYYVTFAGFIASVAVFVMICGCIKGCKRLWPSETLRLNHDEDNEAVPIANGSVRESIVPQKKVKRIKRVEPSKIIKSPLLTHKHNGVTKESLVSRSTTRTDIMMIDASPNSLEGRELTVVDPRKFLNIK